MSDNDKPASTPPAEEHPANQNSPTQPGERLRRILNSRQEASGDTPSTEKPDVTPPEETPQTGQPAKGGPVESQENSSAEPPLPPSEAQTQPFTVNSEIDPGQHPANRPSVEDTRPNAPVSAFTTDTVPMPVPPPEQTRPSPVWDTTAQTIPPPSVDHFQVPPRVDQVDVHATQVTPAAYQPGGGRAPVNYPRSQTPPPQRSYSAQTPTPLRPAGPPPAPPRGSGRAQAPRYDPSRGYTPQDISRPRPKGVTTGCLLRILVIIMFLVTVVVVLASAFAIYQYFSIASTLPNVEDLRKRASQFETTRILDRNGNVLYEILDPNAGRRTYIALDKISPYLIAATLATEDKDFYIHPGFDVLAVIRSLWQNYTIGETYTGPGASTITQQLARHLLLSPSERTQRTVQRKAREIVLSAEITRRYSKEEILEIYLNEIFYGNNSYGIEAAAETYFSVPATKLTLGQSAFLAGLPQAPSVYDIYTNKTQTLERFNTVIQLMFTLSQERGCISVSTNVQPVCVDAVAATKALDEINNYAFVHAQGTFTSPHWVTYIRSLLEQQYDPQTIYRSGFTVYTTLDPALQKQAEQTVKQQVVSLADKKVTDGALVAIRPASGEILAMVGSADFYNDKIAGQINMAISPRQPGSSIKPLTYVAAFEKGWNPATLIWDVPSEFPPSGDPNDTRAPYKPTNYDGKAHGPLSVRTALSNSFNVPAVKALQFIGLYNQGGLVPFAKRLGITTLTRQDYGLSLTLGGGEVTPLELTGAYAVYANGGRRMPTYAISKIVDYQGKTVFEYKPPAGDQVVRPEHAYLITSILSDTTARIPMFGTNPVINLPFQAAVKTGTTNDFRDNWTVGYTPDIAVGVWVGNADYSPMVNTTGLTGAAPIWADFMKYAIQTMMKGKPTAFIRPAGIVERAVCEISGTEASEWCPKQRGEIFAYDQLPPAKDQDLWQKVTIDTWTGLKASAACGEYTDEKLAMNVKDKWAIKWIKDAADGKAWAEKNGFGTRVFFAPDRECRPDDPHPKIVFSALSEGQTITTAPLDIYAVIDAPDFKSYQLSYGVGDNPVEMKKAGDPVNSPAKDPTKIFSLDLKDIPPGKFTLVIRLDSSREGYYAKKGIHLVNGAPTATPTPTTTTTPTSTPTLTPTPTNTALPTPVPSQTPVPPTVAPSLTPTSTKVLTPTFTKT